MTESKNMPSRVEFKDELVSQINAVRRFAKALTYNDSEAEDLAQETLEEALRSEANYEPGSRMASWLFTIERRLWFKRIRKKVREKGFSSMDADGWSADGEENLCVQPNQEGHLHMEDASRALDCLPPEQREALLLVTLEGYSYEEVARICGCQVGTVKSRISRARTYLLSVYKAGRIPRRASGKPALPQPDSMLPRAINRGKERAGRCAHFRTEDPVAGEPPSLVEDDAPAFRPCLVG